MDSLFFLIPLALKNFDYFYRLDFLQQMFFCFFYLFIFSNVLFIFFVRNVVYSILILVSIFCLGSVLLIYFEMEFFGMIYLVVYVGAISILFLFIVMMINRVNIYFSGVSQFSYLKKNINLKILAFLFLFYNFFTFFSPRNDGFFLFSNSKFYKDINYFDNINLIGDYIYTYQFFLFILSAYILLIAMVGAIVLTFEKKISHSEKYQGLEFNMNKIRFF